MKKNLPRPFSCGKMHNLARVALAALVCSVGSVGAYASTDQTVAQQQQSVRRTVAGVVTDNQGRPLAGASVMVVGASGVGVNTDASGRYSLGVARGARLSISFMGYTTQTVAVGEQTTIDVRLQPQVLTTQAAVVTGIFNKPRESYTSAAATITGTELMEAGGGSLITGLRNLDPTFYLAEDILNGSDPNALPMVTMRGSTTLPISVDDMTQQKMSQSNLPLVILNNFEVPFSRLVDIDQYQVETITLLKDAGATSIYGTRGANGVVVITTKLPKEGALQLTYNGRSDIQVADLSSYNLMNASEKLEYERLAGMYKSDNWVNQMLLTDRYNKRLTEVLRGVDTDWLHYPVRVAVGHSHSVRAEGGDQTMRYALNLGYNNKVGVMKGSNREALNAGINFSYNVKKFQFQNDLQVSNTHEQNSPYGAFSTYAEMNPYFKPYDNDGNLERIVDKDNYYSGLRMDGDVNVRNPLWDAVQPSKNTRNDFMLTNNFLAEWRVVPELFLKGSVAVSIGRSRADLFKSAGMHEFDNSNYTGANSKYKGSYRLDMGQSSRIEGALTANYSKTFNDVHQLFAGVSGNLTQNNTQNYWQTGYGISDPDNVFYGAAMLFRDTDKPNGTDNLSRAVRLSATLNYTYDSRYFVDLSGSYNGSSLFGENNRFAPIWSAGAGWNMHREQWFAAHAVDYARVKANYGLSASTNFEPYLSQVMFRDMGLLYDIWGGSQMQGIGNKDLKWQQTYQWNVGAETALLKNRFSAEVNVYHRRTKNLLADVDLPPAAGYRSYKANVGEIENKGFEVKLNATIIQNRERQFYWSVGGTAMHNQNKILKISESLKKMNEEVAKAYADNVNKDNYRAVTVPAFQFLEGYSQNTIFVVQSLGIDPISGKEILVSRDGLPYYGDQWNIGDQVPWGNKDPKLSGAINTQLRWRGWRMTAFFAYSVGGKDYAQALASKVETITPWLNADRRALYDRWSKEGQRAQFKAINSFLPTKPTSRFVMKNNYLSLSKLTLAYDVPVEWSKRVLGIEYLSATGEMGDVFHLATIKRERGTAYPYARTFSVSLTARF